MLSKTANRLVLAATSLAFALSPALGQSDSNSIRKALGDYDQSQGAGRSLFTTVGSTFQRLDIDGDGISRKEFDTAEAASMARERAQVAHLILHWRSLPTPMHSATGLADLINPGFSPDGMSRWTRFARSLKAATQTETVNSKALSSTSP